MILHNVFYVFKNKKDASDFYKKYKNLYNIKNKDMGEESNDALTIFFSKDFDLQKFDTSDETLEQSLGIYKIKRDNKLIDATIDYDKSLDFYKFITANYKDNINIFLATFTYQENKKTFEVINQKLNNIKSYIFSQFELENKIVSIYQVDKSQIISILSKIEKDNFKDTWNSNENFIHEYFEGDNNVL
ncbi:hypothetical protein [Marinitoga sp. 1155]|uniref:hypothetical protein n=1 Tax=Marinitoga sp. 1155 TaxID=1428448 RepID=UPI0006414D46|nr:hypothetical protein [Marinitoga sp. 1155]KLO24830.1 hypothetical protein X274_02500 [Marinitoga sp. 1155]